MGQALPTLPTLVALPLPLGVPTTFVRLSKASFMSQLLAPPPCRAGPFPWLALWYGMVSHGLSGHFQEYSPRNSVSNLKQHYSAVLGLGALLSSPVAYQGGAEGASRPRRHFRKKIDVKMVKFMLKMVKFSVKTDKRAEN